MQLTWLKQQAKSVGIRVIRGKVLVAVWLRYGLCGLNEFFFECSVLWGFGEDGKQHCYNPLMAEKLLFIPWLMGVFYSSIPLFWFAIHPFAPRWRRMQHSPYRILLPLWTVIIAILAVATWPWHGLQLYSAWWTWLLALLLIAASARTYRKIRSAFGVSRFIGQAELRPGEHQQSLITTGLHGRMRHPIYVAHLGMLAGWTVGSGLLIDFLLLAISACCTFPLMIWLEERELEKRFGPDYCEYKKRVPLLPCFGFHHENHLHGDIVGH